MAMAVNGAEELSDLHGWVGPFFIQVTRVVRSGRLYAAGGHSLPAVSYSTVPAKTVMIWRHGLRELGRHDATGSGTAT